MNKQQYIYLHDKLDNAQISKATILEIITGLIELEGVKNE